MAHLTNSLLGNAVAGALVGRPTSEGLGSRDADCSVHGGYTSHGVRYLGKHDVWTQCAGCSADAAKREREEELSRTAVAQRTRVESMIDDAAIPSRFIGCNLDNFNASTDEQKAALRVAREYVERFQIHRQRGTGLIFCGTMGTGKSHLATAIMQALLPQHPSLYITAIGIVRAIRGTWRKDSEHSESQVLAMLGDIPLLVIDEIGVQYGTDGEQTILFDVLDRRYRERMPTILLTNQDLDGFKSYIGERSYDRLTESCRLVRCDWDSYRKIARKELL